MASLNKMTIIGNVGQEPEMRFTGNGKPVTNFSVATSHKYTVDGEQREETQWFTIVAWGKLAELCNQYVTKGMMVYAEGRFQDNEWESEDGQKRHRLEIVANTVLFLSRKEKAAEETETNVEDLPF